MHYVAEYALFLAKVLTIFGVVVLIVAGLAIMVLRARATRQEHLAVRHLNEKYEAMELALKSAILSKKAFKQTLKALKAEHKRHRKAEADPQILSQNRVFVLTFKGDMAASAVESLREEITAVLMVATEKDEVVVLLESPGGLVHSYGLAASQLRRIRDRSIPLTVSVDKVAASGGYMIACVADRIIAAPFAIVGSIGVVGQLPNFNRLLKNHDVDYELVTAGEYKRTLTVFGENTEKGREKYRQEIEDTHALFKMFVKDNRNQVDIEKVATGEYWFGLRALEMSLVDEIRTSDDYLREASRSADLYELSYVRRKRMKERLVSAEERVWQFIRRLLTRDMRA